MSTKLARICILLTVIFISLCGVIVMRGFSVEDTVDLRNVSLNSESDNWEFFDQDTGKIYIYAKADGRVRTIWRLKRLGADMQRLSRSGDESY